MFSKKTVRTLASTLQIYLFEIGIETGVKRRLPLTTVEIQQYLPTSLRPYLVQRNFGGFYSFGIFSIKLVVCFVGFDHGNYFYSLLCMQCLRKISLSFNLRDTLFIFMTTITSTILEKNFNVFHTMQLSDMYYALLCF